MNLATPLTRNDAHMERSRALENVDVGGEQ